MQNRWPIDDNAEPRRRQVVTRPPVGKKKLQVYDLLQLTLAYQHKKVFDVSVDIF